MTTADINRIIGITESYQLPEVLLAKLLDPEERERVFGEFMELKIHLS